MSTTIDQRVVEMRFDNKHFESNVATTMSTLDRLKQKLRFDGAVKGLENVNNATRGFKMDGVANAVDTVSARFSALQVVGMTALANITNSAVNAGKRMIKALTLDPITTGFKEYETQINATQTILANTQHKGSTIEDVNKALEELNKYADLTIYNFTEMTRNIGTFTAAGIDLDTSVNAIQGIANLAAVSGSTSQQASTAMYQLSQALSTGTVRLMDWNSVVNAGMGGEIFQNALKATSEALGTGANAAIEASGSFRESLKDGWLTAEVLTETLKKFTTSGANEYVAEYTGLSADAVEAALKTAEATYGEADAIEYASKALAEKSGKNAQEIADMLNFAKNATDAATKVKTFTQLWDVLKEAAQSGWAQTWKIIVGDFEEAKSLLTPLADFLTGIINGMSEWRNKILESALGKGFGRLSEQLQNLIEPAAKAMNTVKETVDTITDLGQVVDEVILGKFGNGQERFDALAKAGFNYCEVQNEVNKKLGDGFRYTEEQIAAQSKLLGAQKKTNEETEKTVKAQTELTETQKQSIIKLASYNEQQLKSKGYTEEQIAAFKELKDTADKLGLPMDEFVNNLDQIDGRWLIIESLKNAGKGLVAVFNALKDAWQEIFPPKSIEERADQMFNLIAALHKFSRNLLVNEDNAKKFQRTFKGIFAILDVVRIIVGGPLKIAFDAIVHILGLFNLNILDVTAAIGDAAVSFRDWIDSVLDFSAILDPVVQGIMTIVEAWSSWINGLKDSENLPKDIAEGIAYGFSTAFKVVKDFVVGLPDLIKSVPDIIAGMFGDGTLPEWTKYFEIAGQTIVELGKIILKNINEFLSARGFEEISEDAIAGLINGLTNKATEVWNAALEIGKQVLESIKDFLGIHSPSTEMEEVGTNTVDGFILGIQNGSSNVWNTIKGLFGNIVEWIQQLDFGAVIAAVVGIGTAKAANTTAGALANFSEPFVGVGEVLASTAVFLKKMTKPIKNVVNGFAKIEKAVAFNIRMEGVKTLATALLMLAGAVVVMTLVDPKDLWNAVGVIATLAVIIGVLAFAMSKINSASATFSFKEGLDVKGLTTSLIGIGGAILLMAASVKMIGGMNPEEMKHGFLGLAGVVAALALVLVSFSVLNKGSGEAAKNIGKLGGTLLKLSVALLLMVVVVKAASKLDDGTLIQGAKFLGGFLVFLALINTIALMPSKGIDKIGGMMLKLSTAMLLMIAVVKLSAGLTPDELESGKKFAVGFLAFVGILALIGGLGGKSIEGLGKMVLSLSVSMLLLVGVIKLIGMMSPGEMAKGLIAITLFAVIIGVFVDRLTKPYAREAPKVALTILAFAVAIGILSAVAIVCGMISLEGLAKGVVAVGILSAIMALMITATRGASNVTGNIVAITVAIGLMVAAVALLTLIDPTKLAITTTAMTILMGMFALVIKVAGIVPTATGVIIAMTVAIAAIGTVLYLLSGLHVESVIGSALALAGLMVVMTGLLYLLVPIGSMIQIALLGVLSLAAMAVPLIAFVGVLAAMKNMQNAMENAKALSLFAVAMTGVLAILTILGPAAMLALPAMGALAALVGVMAGILAALGLLSKIPGFNKIVADGGATLSLIGTAIGAFVGSIVAGLASAVLTILPTLGIALSGFMTGVQPFIVGAKSIDESVLTGIGCLAAAILALTAANIVTGLASLAGLSLVSLGQQLSGFIVAAMPFITTAATITPDMMSGVKALAETILILTAADIISGLASFITGGSSLDSFASQLPKLGEGLSAFSSSLGAFTDDQLATVNCAAQAVKTLAQASSEIPNAGGLLGMLVGENDLGVFADQFPILGTGLRGFLDNVGEFTDAQITTVNCAAQAIKILAQASSEIPNAGGWLGQIVGENDLGTFASQFPVLGTGLRGFLDNVGEFTDTQVTTVNCAAEAIKLLAQASSEIPNSGGWIAQIVGDNDLGTFAEQFPALGTGLRGFLDNVGDIDESANATVTAGAKAVAALATAASGIPNEGGWISKLFGDNNLSTFADNFPALGSALRGFIDNIGTFTDVQIETVRSTVTAVNALSGLANANLSGASKHLGDFGNDLPDFAADVADFCTNMPTTDSMSAAISNLDSILAAVQSIGNANSGCLATFADNLKKVGKNAVDKFVEAFTSDSAKTDLKNAAIDLGEQVVDGIEKKEKSVETAAKNVAAKASDGVRDKYNSMKSAGKYLVDGFAAGITDRTWYAEAKAKAMANAAEKAAKEALDINSPSKVFRAIGYSVPEGFAMGIDRMTRLATSSASGMSKATLDTVKNSISRIADLVNTDIDAQPTIRPVLDLSDIKSGAGAIGGLLGAGGPIGVRANVSAINSMMGSRGQNGTNADVIAAINKLRDRLDNVGNTTYSINGVTYDDGSNIAEAVRTITRAAVRERRV